MRGLTDQELLRLVAYDAHPVVRELAARLEKRVDAAADVHAYAEKLPLHQVTDALEHLLDLIEE